MTRAEVKELHYIAPLANVPSILGLGILSHDRAAKVPHLSVAMLEIQTRRTDKQIPGAGNLHSYVNLYFDAHNPMLSKVRDKNDEICVLRIDVSVLDLPEVIIADRNASSDYVNFHNVAQGLKRLEHSRLFAQYWTHPNDPLDELRHKSEKCAEVLVPDKVSAEYIAGAYVANENVLQCWQGLGAGLGAVVKAGLFF